MKSDLPVTSCVKWVTQPSGFAHREGLGLALEKHVQLKRKESRTTTMYQEMSAMNSLVFGERGRIFVTLFKLRIKAC